jgi:hypothetical protein
MNINFWPEQFWREFWLCGKQVPRVWCFFVPLPWCSCASVGGGVPSSCVEELTRGDGKVRKFENGLLDLSENSWEIWEVREITKILQDYLNSNLWSHFFLLIIAQSNTVKIFIFLNTRIYTEKRVLRLISREAHDRTPKNELTNNDSVSSIFISRLIFFLEQKNYTHTCTHMCDSILLFSFEFENNHKLFVQIIFIDR